MLKKLSPNPLGELMADGIDVIVIKPGNGKLVSAVVSDTRFADRWFDKLLDRQLGLKSR